MSDNLPHTPLSAVRRILFTLVLLSAAGSAAFLLTRQHGVSPARAEAPAQPSDAGRMFYPTAAQWQKLGVSIAEARVFRLELNTDGKIAIDEDHVTPIFSPYTGRVTKLEVKPGEIVERGQLLFTLDASDTLQSQSDLVAAASAVNKSRSQVNLAEVVAARQKDLYAAKAAPLKDWQQAEADLVLARNDLRSAEATLAAASNRLRFFGKTDEEIKLLQDGGSISPETPVFSPIAGTIVQRKVGPGQYVTAGSSDPVFIVGDLSTVWLMANVRETDVERVTTGQALEFGILAEPGRRTSGTVGYVAAAVDPTTRRLPIRATIDNSHRTFKPEMFAMVTIFASEKTPSVAVPREALIYEGDRVRLWVVTPDGGVALRQVATGMTDGKLTQILTGLRAGEKVVTKGNLFVDRIATANAQ